MLSGWRSRGQRSVAVWNAEDCDAWSNKSSQVMSYGSCCLQQPHGWMPHWLTGQTTEMMSASSFAQVRPHTNSLWRIYDFIERHQNTTTLINVIKQHIYWGWLKWYVLMWFDILMKKFGKGMKYFGHMFSVIQITNWAIKNCKSGHWRN